MKKIHNILYQNINHSVAHKDFPILFIYVIESNCLIFNMLPTLQKIKTDSCKYIHKN